jgi:large conductance mechanosensitive channel
VEHFPKVSTDADVPQNLETHPMALVQELKAFLMRGNVVDLAVGVVIGAAFGKIVDAVVGGVLMPIVGVLTGGLDVSSMSFTLYGDAKILYGVVLQNLINFTIVGTFLFFVIKAVNKMKPKEEEKPKETPEDVKLLGEIRDLLAKK